MTINRHLDSSNVRRVTLSSDPYTHPLTNLPWVSALDVKGYQYQIDLSVLPAKTTLKMIRQGQQWFVENRTSSYKLYLSCSELVPGSYARFYPSNNYVTTTSWTTLPYDTVQITQSGSLGSITISGSNFYLPVEGVYAVNASAQVVAGQNNGYLSVRINYPSYGTFFPQSNSTFSSNLIKDSAQISDSVYVSDITQPIKIETLYQLNAITIGSGIVNNSWLTIAYVGDVF